jgi:hypothetical protein
VYYFSVHWSLIRSDDTPANTDKSRLMHCLESDLHVSEKPAADKNIYIIDGNVMFHSQVALPSTFGELADSLFSHLLNVPRVEHDKFVLSELNQKHQEKQERDVCYTLNQRLSNQGP